MALGSKLVPKDIFGERVFIRTLNGGKNAAKVIELSQQAGAKPWLIPEIGALLVVECLRDESGNQLYTDPDKVREEAAVGFLVEFMTEALEISGMGDDAAELRKNSPAVQ